MNLRLYIEFLEHKYCLVSDIDNVNVDNFYDPRVIDISTFTHSKKSYFLGSVPFNDVRIKLNNSDNYFNNLDIVRLANKNVYVHAYINNSFFETNLLIIDANLTEEHLELICSDNRRRLNNNLQLAAYTTSVFPFLNSDNINIPIPKLQGKIFGAPCICINELDPGLPRYTFKICDTSKNPLVTIDKVYVKSLQITPYSMDILNGLVIINTSDLPADGDKFITITVDVTGNVQNGAQQVIDLIVEATDLSYTDFNYNLLETNKSLLTSRFTSYYVAETRPVLEIINQICDDIDAAFYTDFSGKFVIKLYDINRVATKRIFTHDWIDEPKKSTQLLEYMTSASINYAKNINKKTYKNLYDDSKETDRLMIYEIKKTVSRDTGLTTPADAQAKADNMYAIYSNATYEITRSILLDFDNFLDIMDFCICDAEKNENFNTYEITGVSFNLLTGLIKYTFRYIQNFIGLDEYFLLVDEFGNYIVDEFGNYLVSFEAAPLVASKIVDEFDNYIVDEFGNFLTG